LFDAVTLFADLAATAVAVAATRSRIAKLTALADLLARLDRDEIEPAVALLSGTMRQGRIGVGWATIAAVEHVPAVDPSLTIGAVDDALTALAGVGGAGSAAARGRILGDLLALATADEADLLRRVLVGEVRLGALEGIVTDAVARASGVPLETVRRAAMLAGDLPAVARAALTDGEAALSEIRLTVLRPVQPMLAATAADVGAALEATGEASVEWKLDGARIQVHVQGEEVRVYTRNLNDVTSRLPGIVSLVRTFPATALVLDGEAIGLAEDERPDRFQDTMSRFGSQTDGAAAVLVARFFDCLHRDGEDLLDRPLRERLAILDEVVGAAAMPRIATTDAGEAARFLETSLALGHEGVMVKALDSPYEAGRRGGAWRKVKPVRTLDLVVLAAEWGHGRRQGWLSNLHLGAREGSGEDQGGFVMVGKTFKGLTDALLTWQTAALLELEERRTGHTVWVRPELVVEVALDGVQASTRYPGGVALRFARVRGYRDDKGPADADTIETVQAMLLGRNQ
jgi:DNA ligase-1